ncbi:MAG: hypothetical protein ACUVQQ_15205 [Thermogutta sp.]
MSYRNLSIALAILCFGSGLAYMIFRYAESGESIPGVLGAATVFGVAWFWAFALSRCVGDETASSVWPVLTIALAFPCLALLGQSLNRHIWRNLVALESLDCETPQYILWNQCGTTQIEPNTLDLRKFFHRGGDETAHLAAALAMRETGGNPSAVAKLIGKREGHNRAYWLRRALSGHPPGLALLYAPVATNPPLARVWAALVFGACAVLAYWAGNQWSPGTRYGLFAATVFVSIPNLTWWHAFSVSSDIPPALFTFTAFGLVGRAVRNDKLPTQASGPIALAGVLLGIGCLVTLTAALPAFALAFLILTTRREGSLRAAMWLLVPSALCVLAGVGYSKLAVPGERPGLFARVAAVAHENNVYTSPLEGLLTFVRRLPMDLGIPVTILFFALPLLMFCRQYDNRVNLPRLGKLLGGGCVLIPAATFFWPEIRFAYPGFLVVLVGLGFQDFWESVSPRLRAFIVASVFSFGFAKFVLHNLLVAA